jgi:alpha-beta hydrolase superfamily lysophospholipase
MTPAQAAAKLDAFITLRGAIAHRGQGASAVTKVHADDFINLVSELVTLTDDAVRNHVQSVAGQPMPLVR